MTRIQILLSPLLILSLMTVAAQAKNKTPEALLGAALHQEEVKGNLEAAIATYQRFLAEHGANRILAAKAQRRIGACYEKLGKAEARNAYERVISNYADQQEFAAQARARLAALGDGNRSSMVARQVCIGPEVDATGAPSPDGRYLSYVHWDTGDLAGELMKVLEIVLQIITVSIMVAFAVTLGSITWLCFCEWRNAQRSRPLVREQKDEKIWSPLPFDIHTLGALAHSWPGALPPQYAAWARRIFSRSGR